MKRSEINAAIRRATAAFERSGWALPPNPKSDVTYLGLGRFEQTGLVLVDLSEEPEYCKKLMCSQCGEITPMHAHRRKKEDIICRRGTRAPEVWRDHPERCKPGKPVVLKRSGVDFTAESVRPFTIISGERVTIVPGVYHAFRGGDDGCVIGEVSTANDVTADNFFVDPEIRRFAQIEEDETADVGLVGEP